MICFSETVNNSAHMSHFNKDDLLLVILNIMTFSHTLSHCTV